MSWYRVFYTDYPFNFPNWFLHPRLTKWSLFRRWDECVFAECMVLSESNRVLTPEAEHNTPKPSGSIYDLMLLLLWVYRTQMRTLQCQALSRCQENTCWTREVLLLLLSGNFSSLTHHDMWSRSHLGMWYMSHSVAQKICSFIHLHANYRCLWIKLLHLTAVLFLFSSISFLSFSCNVKVLWCRILTHERWRH